MALFKIVFEYGLVGALLYFGFPVRLPVHLESATPAHSRRGHHLPAQRHVASFAHGMALGLLLWCPLERGTPLRALNIRTDAT